MTTGFVIAVGSLPPAKELLMELRILKVEKGALKNLGLLIYLC